VLVEDLRKVIIYVRISDFKKVEDGYSLDAQE